MANYTATVAAGGPLDPADVSAAMEASLETIDKAAYANWRPVVWTVGSKVYYVILASNASG